MHLRVKVWRLRLEPLVRLDPISRSRLKLGPLLLCRRTTNLPGLLRQLCKLLGTPGFDAGQIGLGLEELALSINLSLAVTKAFGLEQLALGIVHLS